MVRLLLPDFLINLSRLHAFQSHNGAIAARCHSFRCVYVVELSIPQWCDCCEMVAKTKVPTKVTFNPTMVRLLPMFQVLVIGALTIFQSHNGAIAAERRREIMEQCEISFNPTMVRLLLEAVVAATKLFILSIPQWCDCCL